ncbi:MAG: M42 family peptidase [Oscillospiraceae bacterium]|nr:M42 family peptidase [Oscillospiraceae bacterium]
MTSEELKSLTIQLADINGVSGDEGRAAQFCREYLERYSKDVTIKNGNVIAYLIGREKRPLILLDAHLDRVGMIVCAVEDGFVKAAPVGGIDMRIMPAQRVIIHGKEDIKGVICTLPPHLAKESKVTDKDDLWIDTGLDSAEKYISQGDMISYDSPVKELLHDRIAGAGLDDRCGISTILCAVDMLKSELSSLDCSVAVMFSTHEEINERGACIGAFDIEPDIALEVDVSFAMCGGEDASKCSKPGNGVMIGISPSLGRGLSDTLIALAEKNNIPYTTEIMHRTTGTNADRFSVTKGGVRAGTLSLPLRYMHTPAEVIDINDCMSTAKLIAAYLRSVKGDNNG